MTVWKDILEPETACDSETDGHERHNRQSAEITQGNRLEPDLLVSEIPQGVGDDLDVPDEPGFGGGEIVEVKMPDVMPDELADPADVGLDLKHYLTDPTRHGLE